VVAGFEGYRDAVAFDDVIAGPREVSGEQLVFERFVPDIRVRSNLLIEGAALAAPMPPCSRRPFSFSMAAESRSTESGLMLTGPLVGLDVPCPAAFDRLPAAPPTTAKTADTNSVVALRTVTSSDWV
jgi:hypothetical protein